MDTRQIGIYASRGRVVLGLSLMVAPGPTLTLALGRGAAATSAARAVGRLAGVRDAVIGAGGSIAAGQRSGGGDWLSMMAVCDGVDALVMLATPGLPKRTRLLGLFAAGSAVAHLYLARDLAAEEHPTPV
jgi:hypothetical protein